MRRTRHRSCSLLALLLIAYATTSVVGCKSGPQPTDKTTDRVVEQPAEPRSVTLAFVLTEEIARDLAGPPTGELRGAIFRTTDVGAFGPKDRAEAVAKIEPRRVDLGADTPPTWTTPELPPGEYTFLGFVDLDDNSPDGPDDGDIVTRPATNRFTLSNVGETLEVRFDYIKGSTIFG